MSTSARAAGIEDGPDANQHTKLSSQFRNHIVTHGARPHAAHDAIHPFTPPPTHPPAHKALEEAAKEGDFDKVCATLDAKTPTVRGAILHEISPPSPIAHPLRPPSRLQASAWLAGGRRSDQLMANLAAARAKDTDDTLLHVCESPEIIAGLLGHGCDPNATNKVLHPS